MSLVLNVTQEGLTAANAEEAAGFLIKAASFSVSATAGVNDNTRTYASRNATWYTGTINSITTIDANTVNYECVVPVGANANVSVIVGEVYLEGIKTDSTPYLLAIGQPSIATLYDPSGTLTFNIRVQIASVALSSYNFTSSAAADIAAHEANPLYHPKSNQSATGAPTILADTAAGYRVGSHWIDTTNDKAYICVDATVGAAIWHQVDVAGTKNNLSATAAPAVTDDASVGYAIGSEWVDTVNDRAYICVDDTMGAAA